MLKHSRHILFSLGFLLLMLQSVPVQAQMGDGYWSLQYIYRTIDPNNQPYAEAGSTYTLSSTRPDALAHSEVSSMQQTRADIPGNYDVVLGWHGNTANSLPYDRVYASATAAANGVTHDSYANPGANMYYTDEMGDAYSSSSVSLDAAFYESPGDIYVGSPGARGVAWSKRIYDLRQPPHSYDINHDYSSGYFEVYQASPVTDGTTQYDAHLSSRVSAVSSIALSQTPQYGSYSYSASATGKAWASLDVLF